MPSTATMEKPSTADTSASTDGVQPDMAAAVSRIASPGMKWTPETSSEATGNTSRGRYTLRTSAALPTTECVALIRVSVKKLIRTKPENMKIVKSSTCLLIWRKTPTTKKYTAKCTAGRT